MDLLKPLLKETRVSSIRENKYLAEDMLNVKYYDFYELKKYDITSSIKQSEASDTSNLEYLTIKNEDKRSLIQKYYLEKNEVMLDKGITECSLKSEPKDIDILIQEYGLSLKKTQKISKKGITVGSLESDSKDRGILVEGYPLMDESSLKKRKLTGCVYPLKKNLKKFDIPSYIGYTNVNTWIGKASIAPENVSENTYSSKIELEGYSLDLRNPSFTYRGASPCDTSNDNLMKYTDKDLGWREYWYQNNGNKLPSSNFDYKYITCPSGAPDCLKIKAQGNYIHFKKEVSITEEGWYNFSFYVKSYLGKTIIVPSISNSKLSYFILEENCSNNSNEISIGTDKWVKVTLVAYIPSGTSEVKIEWRGLDNDTNKSNPYLGIGHLKFSKGVLCNPYKKVSLFEEDTREIYTRNPLMFKEDLISYSKDFTIMYTREIHDNIPDSFKIGSKNVGSPRFHCDTFGEVEIGYELSVNTSIFEPYCSLGVGILNNVTWSNYINNTEVVFIRHKANETKIKVNVFSSKTNGTDLYSYSFEINDTNKKFFTTKTVYDKNGVNSQEYNIILGGNTYDKLDYNSVYRDLFVFSNYIEKPIELLNMMVTTLKGEDIISLRLNNIVEDL